MRRALRFLSLAGLLAWGPHAVWAAPGAEAPQPDAHSRVEAGRLNDAATRALNSGRYSDAIGLLLRAERLLPGDPGIAFNLGLSYVRAGRFREAVAPLRRACADPARRPAARFLLGSALFEDAQYGPAAAELEAMRENPEFAENALYLLEESYRKSGQAERAQQAFLDLVKLRPDSALVHKLLGTAYDAQGRSAEALVEFEKAAQAGPGLPEVRLDAGLVYLKLHDEPAARKWLDAEIALNPCSAPAHYFLGEIDRKQSRPESAEAAYRKAIRCAPDYGDAYLALGVVLQERGRNAEALSAFQRAVALQPAKSEAHFQLARALAKAGRKAEAQAEWKKAQDLASGPDSKPARK